MLTRDYKRWGITLLINSGPVEQGGQRGHSSPPPISKEFYLLILTLPLIIYNKEIWAWYHLIHSAPSLLNNCYTVRHVLKFFDPLPTFEKLRYMYIQSWSKLYKRLLYKPYVIGVTLTGQNLSLKCCQSLKQTLCYQWGQDLSKDVQ